MVPLPLPSNLLTNTPNLYGGGMLKYAAIGMPLLVMASDGHITTQLENPSMPTKFQLPPLNTLAVLDKESSLYSAYGSPAGEIAIDGVIDGPAEKQELPTLTHD